MKRVFTFSLAASTALLLATAAWSQTGGAGGGGAGASGSGGTGTAGNAGTGVSGGAGTGAAGTSNVGTAGTAGANGTAGQAGAAGTAGPAGTTGAAGAAGTAGSANVNGTVGTGGAGVGLRANTASGAAGRAATGAAGTVGATGRINAGQSRFNPNRNLNGISQNPFFSDPGVRQQLNLNDNQFNSLNRAYQTAYGRYNQNLNGLNNSLTEQQRQAQMQQFENQFNNDFNSNLNSTFTDPQLRARYEQLNRQYMGFDAFNNGAIQRQLNLTPQQLQQLRLLSAQWRQQLQNGTNIDQNQWSQMSSQYWDQLNSVLTPEQQQIWTQLTGQRYNFPPNVYIGANAEPAATSNNVNPQTGIRTGTPGSVPRIVPYGGGNTGNGQNQSGSGQGSPQGSSKK